MRAIIEYGEWRKRESRTTPILENEKNDRAKRLGNDEHTAGAFSHPASSVKCGRAQRLDYYQDMSAYDGSIEVCNLDVDDTTSYGPETITLNPTTNNAYYYYIFRYAGSGTVASSSAKINVYQGDNLIRTFNVPTNLGESDYWNVFAIKNGQLIEENTITDYADTDYAD